MYDYAPKLDPTIVDSQKNLAASESKLGHQYKLLQTDAEVESDPICHSAGCTQYLWGDLIKKDDHPIDYPVPNLGMDRDIANSLDNLSVAEKMVKHRWTDFGTEESKAKWHNKAKDAMYNFAPALDPQIVDSQTNLANAEAKLNHKYTLLQTGEENASDPICNSSGCTQYLWGDLITKDAHPKDYPVPNLGMDRNIADSLDNLGVAEKMVGHRWTNFGTEESKAKYHNKAKDTMYDFAPKLEPQMVDSARNLAAAEGKLGHKYTLLQTDSEVHSDPICNSAGCTQYLFGDLFKKEDIPRDYPVPNLGMDRDVLDSLDNLEVAEDMVGHKWTNFGTEESKKKWHNKALDALYDYNPPLESSMVASQKNLADAETKLGHKYSLV